MSRTTACPHFIESPAHPRQVLHLSGELAGVEVWASCEGFQLRMVDQSPMLEDEPSEVTESEWLEWEAVWQAISRHRWVRYSLTQLDPAIVEEVGMRAQRALAGEPEHVAIRWNDRWVHLHEHL